ncbi:hypothetical protein GH714_032858 [Hevea brasiliensis]|uniref:Uncharacterized protein n=1 Tax=Hevea brasiliensis TaxID=3981 RepID=A0A6A6LSV0_HEVBR|nr:hypothetical protein GH714_032858 [Hevea brasiliensis]
MDKTGAPCYGILDLDTVGIRAMYTPRILKELRQKVRFMLCVGISLDNIIQHHAAVVQGHGGPHNRDDFLTQNDVRNMERVVHNYSHKLHANDDYSVKMWVQRHHKSLPVAGAEPLAAIESYHTRLKLKLFNERHSNSWMRIDGLIRTLTTEFYSLYLLDQYSEESGYFANIRDESFLTNSWHQALHISDIDVMLDEQNLQLAKVISQTDRSRHIQFGILLARPILAVQVYRQALLTLLQNTPDDPLVLEHAILHATRYQRLGRLV